jgi:drug/metabolite transporter (DMT)-like permease
MKTPRKASNHAAWFGPLLGLLGLITYFTVAVRFPELRDSAVANLALVVCGVVVAGWGLLRRRNWKSWVGFGAAGLFAVVFCSYVFFFTSQLPSPDTAPAAGTAAPPLELPDQSGRIVSLDSFRRMSMRDNLHRARVLVVFYRGFW